MTGHNWREADPRGGHGAPPPTVAGVIERTRFAIAATRWAESVLIGIGAGCVLLATISVGGDPLADLDCWGVALLGALVAALSWRIGHGLDGAEVARRLDERMRYRGALVTAFEVESRDPDNPIGRVLRRRVLGRLRQGEAVGALMPPIALPLIAPLAGAGLLAFVLERAATEDVVGTVDLAPLVGELEGLTADTQAAWEEGVLDAETARELLALRRRLRTLASELTRSSADPAATREALEELDRDLVALAPRVQTERELAEALEKMRPWLDAARMSFPETPTDERPKRSAAGGRGGSGTEGNGEGSAAPAPGAEGESPVAAAAGGGSDPAGSGTTGPLDGGAEPLPGAEPEPGSTAGRWWGEEFDEIVASWIEQRRTR